MRRLLAIIHEHRCATCVFHVRGRCLLDGRAVEPWATNMRFERARRMTLRVATAAAVILLVRVASAAVIAAGVLVLAVK